MMEFVLDTGVENIVAKGLLLRIVKTWDCVVNLPLTLYHTIRLLTTLRKETSENIFGKREIAG